MSHLPRIIAGLHFPVPHYVEGELDGSHRARPLTCHVGHASHGRLRVRAKLVGQGVVSEYPAIPDRLARSLRLDVYDAPSYASSAPRYCTGHDETSKALLLGQVWEGYETLLVLAILAAGQRDRVVLDFGAHLGWYSTLAASSGYDTVAFEADHENAVLCAHNAALNGARDYLTVITTWIDSGSPALPVDAEEVELLKSDLEGAEDHVERMCRDLFEVGRVRYALLEVSPVFSGHYPETLARIAAAGYVPHDVPSKGASPELKAAFEADPLAAVRLCRVDDPEAYLRGVSQTNFLFIRKDLA